MENENKDDIVVCSLCGSRTGPFKNIRQGGSYSKILGCACVRCQELDGIDWFNAVRPILPKE